MHDEFASIFLFAPSGPSRWRLLAGHDDLRLAPSPLLGALVDRTCKEDMLFKDDMLDVHVVV